MSEYNITTCDLCAPSGVIKAVQNGVAPKKGYILSAYPMALENAGWQEQDVGHVCPSCQAEQKARAERDVAEEASSENGPACTLEEGLARLETDLAKLLSPAAEAKVKAAIAERGLETTWEKWVEDTKVMHEVAKESLRKSFGQA